MPKSSSWCGIADPAVGLGGFDLREQHVDRVRLARDLAQPGEPRLQLGILVGQAVDRLLELDVAPDAQLVEMILGLGPLEMVQRRLGLAPVVEQVGQVDPRFGEARLQLQRPAQPVE